MITTQKLLLTAPEVYYYNSPYKYTVKPAYGLDPLPEWEEKLGDIECPSPFVAVLEDVFLAGSGLVGFKDDDVVLDTTYFGRYDLWKRNRPYFVEAHYSLAEEPVEIPCAVSFGSVWTYNYFHWVIDILPKLEAVTHYQTEAGEFPVILIPKNPPRFALESLDYLGVEYTIAEAANYRVERLVIPSTRRHNGYVHPSAIRYLRKVLSRKRVASDAFYISRKLAPTRRVVNEANVVRFLQRYGVSQVSAESFPWMSQLTMFTNAGFIVGPHGAGLVNMVFADKPKVLELVTPAYTNPCCWLLAASQGWDYGYVVGDKVDPEDMRIDIDKLEKTTEGVLYGETTNRL